MAEDLKVGSAYVELYADDSHLAADARGKVEAALGGLDGTVRLHINDAEFRQEVAAAAKKAGEGQGVDVKVGVDPQHLRTEVSEAVSGAGADEEVKVELGVEGAHLREEISAEVQAAQAGESVTIPVRVDVGTATEQLAAVETATRAVDAAGNGLTQDAQGRWRNALGQFASDAEKAAAGVEDFGQRTRTAGGAAAEGSSGLLGLSGMMWATVAAGSALAPVIAALPALLGGAGSAVATLGLGFSGVIGALHDYSAATGVAGQSSAQLAQTSFSNALAIQADQRAIADAKRQAADAAIQSANAIIAADEQVAAAEHAAADAAQALADAKANAENQIADVNNSAADAANSVEDAKLAAERAQQNYDATMANSLSTDLQKREAAQQLADAQQAVTDAQQRSKEATEAATKANQEGADGLPSVVQAQYSYEQAIQGVADALRNQADTQRSAAEQQQQSIQAVKDAEENLSNTYKEQALAAAAASAAGGAGMNKFASDMAKLTPAGRDLVNQLLSMKDGFHELSATAQTTMLPGFTQMLRDLAPMLPVFNTEIGTMGTVLGGLASQFGALFQDPAFRGALITVLQEGTGLVQQLGSGFVEMFGGITQAAAGAGPIVQGLGQGFHDLMASGIPAFFRGLTVDAGGAGQTLGGVLGIVSNLLGPIGTLAGAFSGALGPALAILAPAIGEIATGLTQDLLPVMGPLSDVLQSVAQFVADNTAVLTPLVGAVLAGVAAFKAFNLVTSLGRTIMDAYKTAVKLFTAESVIAQVATKAWAIAQAALNLVLDANPIMLVVLAIGGLVAAVIEAWNHFQGFRDFIKQMWTDVVDVFKVSVAIITTEWKTVLDALDAGRVFIEGVWKKIEAATLATWQLVKSYIIDPVKEAFDWVSTKIGDLVGWFKDLPGRLAKVGSGMWDWVKDTFKDSINTIIRWWNGLSFGIPTVHVPGTDWDIGGGSIGVPKIPLLAAGGTAIRPGWAVVGDNGPELMPMAPGTAVVPLDDKTRAAAVGALGVGSPSGGIHVHGDIHVNVSAMYDFSNPNAMSATSRRAAVQIRDALRQVEGSYT